MTAGYYVTLVLFILQGQCQLLNAGDEFFLLFTNGDLIEMFMNGRSLKWKFQTHTWEVFEEEKYNFARVASNIFQ